MPWLILKGLIHRVLCSSARIIAIMLEVLWSTILGLIASLTPGVFLRLFMTVERVKKDFEVDLRSEAPVDLTFSGAVPDLDVWLRCTNKSAVPVVVDRVLFKIWVGQPIIDGAILQRTTVGPKENRKLYFHSILSNAQQAAIKKHVKEEGLLDVPIEFHMEVHYDCKVGPFRLTVHKRHTPAIVRGLPRATPTS